MARVRPRVMVVDDSPVVRLFVSRGLELLGYAVIVVENQIEVAFALARERPDIVLLDVDMPGLTGDFILTALKAGGSHPCVIVFHSDRSDPELAELVARTGADGYIRKTGDPQVLAGQIQHHLERAAGQR